MTFDFEIRPREDQDIPFIVGYWFESLCREGLAQRCTAISRVKAAIGERLRTYAREMPCYVAHDPDDRDALWGFVIGTREPSGAGIIYWCYVTKHRRNAGIARALTARWDDEHGPIVAHRYACAWTQRHSRELPLCEEALR